MISPYPIADYDDAYANGAHVPNSEDYPFLWASRAKAFRNELAAEGRARLDIPYGPGERHRLDLFSPAEGPRGLFVFVHGGYWKAFDKSCWSHLAAGALARGFAVAMPSYTLAPDARIRAIGLEIAQAVGRAAELVPGPVVLAGHSAGGHLVSRLVSKPSPLEAGVLERVRHVVTISGVHDLRPMLRLAFNETLRIDPAEAQAESPALLEPEEGRRVTCWVGADERPEFLRQNRILHEMWLGFGVRIARVEEEGRHHYNVIEGLADPRHELVSTLVEA